MSSVDTSYWNDRAGNLTWVPTAAGLVRPVNVAGKAINYSHSFASTAKDCPRKAWMEKIASAPDRRARRPTVEVVSTASWSTGDVMGSGLPRASRSK